jgi:hypothetical protein
MAVPISNVVRRIVFAPSGTGPYAFTFEILAATDIEVYKGDTLLTLTTDYTVTINPNGTGEVTLVATAGTDNITIVGARTIQRTTDFVTGGDLFANSLNDELDSLTIFVQQNAEAGDRAIRAPVTDPTTIDMTLPTKTDRAGKYLSFNASTGDPEVVNTVVDVTTVAANIANINTVAGISGNVTTVAGLAANVTTVAGIAANVTTVAGISSNVTTVAGISADVTTVAADGTDIGTVAGLSTEIAALGPIAADITTVAGIDSDVTAVAADATDIGTVAGSIANVNTVAGIDADVTTVAGISADVTAVAGDATDIGTVAGIAANVTTVAGIAANVTTVAGISSDVTTVATNVTDITNFSDVYLGPASSDPATRNDSSALQAGDLYFDTVADAMKVYTGSAWVAAYISGSGFVDLSSAQTITGAKTFGADVTLNGQSDLRFADSDSSNWVAFQAPATVAADVTWTLPSSDGTSGQVLQTNGSGALSFVSVAAFDSGTVMLFAQTAAPTGWTKDTSLYNNSGLRVVTGTASTGGSVDFTTAFASQTPSGTVSVSGSAGDTTLSTPQIPSHAHNITAHNTGSNNPGLVRGGSSPVSSSSVPTDNTGGGGAHSHPLTISSSTFSGNAINLAVKYVDVIRATKD